MQRSDLIKVIALGAGAIAVLFWLMFNGLFGTSELVVFPMPGQSLTVQLDDGATVPLPGPEPVRLEARPGSHTVTVRGSDGAAFTVKVKPGGGGERWVVPAADAQCFAIIDATRLFQHSTAWAQGVKPPRPRLDERWTDHQAKKLTRGMYTSLPRSVKGGEVKWVVGLPCEALKQSQDELLSSLGL